MVSSQVPVPVQSPLQPIKVVPGAGLAFSVTRVPLLCPSEQSLPQFMPMLVTVPLPVRVTWSP